MHAHNDLALTEPLSPRRERWLLLALAGIQFTHTLDFMIMMPLGPQFRALFGITDAQFGVLVSAYTLAAGASGLLASAYVDRFGRRNLLLAMYGLFGLATLACGLAPGYLALMAARIAAGAFGGVLSALIQTIVAEVVPFERRGRAMAVVMTSFSVATVAGVPLGLWMAARFSWHAPFFAIAGLSLLLGAMAAATLPALRAHLDTPAQPLARMLRELVADANHQRAFALSALMMCGSFTVIPYITLYMQGNAGLRPDQIPAIYLCGGIATLVTARLIGRLSDRSGKLRSFRWLVLLATLPTLGVTLSAGLPLPGILVLTTLMFVFSSGRMIPGMALVAAAAQPGQRGAFMTLQSAVQSAAIGLASLIGGQLIHRDASGQLAGYWLAALVGVAASAAAWWLAPRLRLHGTGGKN